MIQEKITELANSIARKHAEIMEKECRDVCDRFNCSPSDLIIQYHDKSLIKIVVKGSEFVIENTYTISGD